MSYDFVIKALLSFLIHKALPPGTRRKRKDGIYEKQPNGKWLKVTEGKKEEEPITELTEKINNWNKISDQWEGKENISFRAVNDLEDITKPSIDIFNQNLIEEAGNAYGLTYDEDYNEIPYNEVKEKVLEKLLEQYQENGLDVEYEELEDGSIKFTYPGVNTTNKFDSDVQASYKYFVVLEGEFEGLNYFDALPVISVTDIKAIYDAEGNKIKV